MTQTDQGQTSPPAETQPADTPASGSNSGLGVGIIALLVVVVLIILGFLFISNNSSDQAGAEVQMTAIPGEGDRGSSAVTPAVGGMEVSPETPSAEKATSSDDADGSAAPAEPEVVVVVRTGTEVFAANDNVRLQAAPDRASLVYDSYANGARFVIMTPSAEFDSYPVLVDGREWYRLRADDGLAGWAEVEQLISAQE